MRNLALTVTLCLGLASGALGCGAPGGGTSDDDMPPPAATLAVTPEDVTLEVLNGAAATQAYTATLTRTDGSTEDVTDRVTFGLASTGFGAFNGATLTAPGSAAGVTEVRAVLADVIGTARLTVKVRGVRVEPPAPMDAPTLFGAATEAGSQAPALVYPDDRVVMPPNIGEFDVHWRDTVNNDLFEVTLKNEFVDLRLYKAGTGALWTVYTPSEWAPLGAARQPIALTVAGLRRATPTTKGTTAARTITLSNDELRGGIYYWATNGSGILRYDAETPSVAPQKLFPAGVPTGCIGCHALSRDGSKIAITFDSAEGRGGVMDLTNNTYSFPYDRGVRWNFATFNPTATELIAVKNGLMTIYKTDGTVVGTVTGVTRGSMPEISPDGAQLAYTEVVSADWNATAGGVFVRDYTEATHTFGPPRMLVAPGQGGLQTYYPSWSPDSQWLVITRNNGRSYDNATSQVWVVKADGTVPPIQLAISNTTGVNLTNSWARWVPFAHTVGPSNEEVFYLTFSSKRPFGTRRATAGAPQIWMTPFYPARAAAGMDPSGPAFRLPFQSLTDNNHIAQWTERVVIP